MEKKGNVLVITNIITAILAVLLGGFIIFDKVINNEEPTKENKVTENNKEPENNDKKEKIILELKENNQKVTYTTDKWVVASSPAIENTIVSKDVANYYKVHVGQSDICQGNEWIIIEKEDKSIIAFNTDDFVCGDRITKKDITQDIKDLGITSIKNIFESKEFVKEYEPYRYQAFVVNQDDQLINISNILEK